MLILIAFPDASYNMEIVNTVPYGEVRTTKYSGLIGGGGELLFAGYGGTVGIFSPPFFPVKLSEIFTSGVVRSFKERNGNLYIALGKRGYEVWQLGDATSPSLLHRGTPSCSFTTDVEAVSGRTFVGTPCGVFVYDSTFSLVGSFDMAVSGLLVHGEILILLGDSILTVDFSDPSYPVVIGRDTVPYGISVGKVWGDYLYVLSGTTALYIYSLPDLTLRTSHYLVAPSSDFVVNDTLLVGVSPRGAVLYLYALTSPTDLTYLETNTISTHGYDTVRTMAMDGDHVYLTGRINLENSLVIFDRDTVKRVLLPEILGEPDFVDNFMYLPLNVGVGVVDITDPGDLAVVGYLNPRGYPYVARWGSGNRVLVVASVLKDSTFFYDLSDPGNPVLLSSRGTQLQCLDTINGTGSCPYRASKDSIFYLGDNRSHGYILDISTSPPTHIGSHPDLSGGHMDVSGNLMLVSTALYDVSDPGTPTYITYLVIIDFGGKIVDNAIIDTFAFSSYIDPYLNISDMFVHGISDPFSPSYLSPPVSGHFIDARNDTIITERKNGVVVQSLRTWDTVAYYLFPEDLSPNGVRFHNMYIYATFRDRGLNIFTFPAPLNSYERRDNRLKKGCLKAYDVSGRLIGKEYRGVVFCRDGKSFRKFIRR